MGTMYDPNNNMLAILNSLDQNGNPGTTIIDPLHGHSVRINYGNSSGSSFQDTITQSGFAEGGTAHTLTWTINWNTVVLSDGSQNYTCTPQGDVCHMYNAGQTVVTSVVLPTPEDNSSPTFQFGYSTNPGWGELNNVILPSGASVHYGYYYESTGGKYPSNLLAQPVNENPVSQKVLTWTDESDFSVRIVRPEKMARWH
jgi:hypothetical protein